MAEGSSSHDSILSETRSNNGRRVCVLQQGHLLLYEFLAGCAHFHFRSATIAGGAALAQFSYNITGQPTQWSDV